MKQRKSIFSGNKRTLLLAVIAFILLLFSAVGSVRAALTYYSENYTAQIETYDIGVTLVEKSAQSTKDISSRDYSKSSNDWKQTQGALLQDMLEETNGKLILGRNYVEELAVKNSGNIEEYVRVYVSKNWTNADGNKETTLAPSLIELHLTQNGWLIDESASTEERTVLYWPNILKPGETTAPFSDTLKIDDSIGKKVTTTTTTEGGLTTITTKFNYDGVQFNIDAQVDAVQTHNAVDAIKSAWGIDVEITENGTLSLVQ